MNVTKFSKDNKTLISTVGMEKCFRGVLDEGAGVVRE